MKDCNCIFCKIANGEIPSTTLYEDEDFRVILDLGAGDQRAMRCFFRRNIIKSF